ncbi:TetR/AcrR family transcriptional regulator [Xylanimonas protaetiae]|nr:TetR/AcrR family transcriptional regulator [Xylanimonas protaetiae]
MSTDDERAADERTATEGTEGARPSTESLVSRLWTPLTPSRRGPRPTLSVDRIVEAAIELADAEGIGAVSMARVGKALGVTPMALYRHVSNKDELLARLADTIAADPPVIPEDIGWRAGLELWMRAQIDMVVARPWYLDLPLTIVLPGPNRLRWIDQAFRLLEGLPLEADEKLALIGTLAQHVLGESRVQAESVAAGENPYEDLELMLQRWADPQTYPHLFAAMATFGAPAEPTAEAPAEPTAEPDQDDVGFGLQIVLDGVEAYVARKTAGRSS